MAGKKSSKQKRKSGNGRSASASKSSATAKKMPSFKGPLSKSTMIKVITDVAGVAKKDVVAVFDTLSQLIEKHVKTGGPFVMPGLYKINVVKKPARSARKGINPFTGEEIMIKARPAYKAVKIKPLKKLKEMVAN
jgi:nucleoid DNA-binding protein